MRSIIWIEHSWRKFAGKPDQPSLCARCFVQCKLINGARKQCPAFAAIIGVAIFGAGQPVPQAAGACRLLQGSGGISWKDVSSVTSFKSAAMRPRAGDFQECAASLESPSSICCCLQLRCCFDHPHGRGPRTPPGTGRHLAAARTCRHPRKKPKETRFRIFRIEHREKQKSLRMAHAAAW